MTALAKSMIAVVIGSASCASAAPAVAAPVTGAASPATQTRLAEPAQVGVYFDYGRPYHRRYRPFPYYGYGYRYYDAPPPATYYETRPYVVERPPPPRAYSGDPDAVARCASRFRSFNVYTGTYVTLEGEERLCPYLR